MSDWIVILTFVAIVLVGLSMLLGKRGEQLEERYSKQSQGLSADEFNRQLQDTYEQNGLRRGRGIDPEIERRGTPDNFGLDGTPYKLPKDFVKINSVPPVRK